MRILRAELAEARVLVKQEMEEYATRSGGDNHGYFNNFFLHFPKVRGGEIRDSFYRRLISEGARGDITYRDIELSTPRYGDQFNSNYSNLALHLTPREFYNLLDWCVETSGITNDKMQRASRRIDEAKGFEGLRRTVIQYEKLLLPAFIRMRALGFNKYDLTG